MKTVAFIPEYHILDTGTASRIDYPSEIESLYDTTVEIVKEEQADITILAGDVLDRQIRNSDNAVKWSQKFDNFHEITDLYSVVGNHELTYQTMFWSLVTRQPVNCSRAKPRTVKGLKEIIKIRDSIEVEGIKIAMIHYGGQLIDADIAIVHGDFIIPQIKRTEEQNMSYLKYIKPSCANELSKYKLAFVAHMHLAQGDYTWENGNRLIFLASTGRTKEPEVQDNFLKRYVWIVKIDDGKIIDVYPREYTLPSRAMCLKNGYDLPSYVKDDSDETVNLECKEKSFIDRAFIKDKIVEYCYANDTREEILSSLVRDDFKYIESIRSELDG